MDRTSGTLTIQIQSAGVEGFVPPQPGVGTLVDGVGDGAVLRNTKLYVRFGEGSPRSSSDGSWVGPGFNEGMGIWHRMSTRVYRPPLIGPGDGRSKPGPGPGQTSREIDPFSPLARFDDTM